MIRPNDSRAFFDAMTLDGKHNSKVTPQMPMKSRNSEMHQGKVIDLAIFHYPNIVLLLIFQRKKNEDIDSTIFGISLVSFFYLRILSICS